jgi:cytochrome c1
MEERMKKVLMVACMSIFVASAAFAAQPKAYQVTGSVLEVGADKIVVQKGEDKWEIARDASTVVSGDLKVGSKVTIEYAMKAKSVEVKQAKTK